MSLVYSESRAQGSAEREGEVVVEDVIEDQEIAEGRPPAASPSPNAERMAYRDSTDEVMPETEVSCRLLSFEATFGKYTPSRPEDILSKEHFERCMAVGLSLAGNRVSVGTYKSLNEISSISAEGRFLSIPKIENAELSEVMLQKLRSELTKGLHNFSRRQ